MTCVAVQKWARLVFCFFLISWEFPLASGKVVAESASEAQSKKLTFNELVPSEEDLEIIDSVSDRANADSYNAFIGTIQEKPFLGLAFAALGSLHTPSQECVSVQVLEESDGRREVLYKYSCKDLRGNVLIGAEQKFDSIYSEVSQDVEIQQNGMVYRLKLRNLQENYKSGSVLLDQEFTQHFIRDGFEHTISGVSAYDFAADETKDVQENHFSLSGVVALDGFFSHTVNGEVQSVRTVSSKDLHHSACGFDEGQIIIRNGEKILTVTYSACGKRSLETEAVNNLEIL